MDDTDDIVERFVGMFLGIEKVAPKTFGFLVCLEHLSVIRIELEPLQESIERHSLHVLIRVRSGQRGQGNQVIRLQFQAPFRNNITLSASAGQDNWSLNWRLDSLS